MKFNFIQSTIILYPQSIFYELINVSAGILLTNDARLNAKDDVVSIESVVGGLLGMVAILLIMVLIWKNRRKIIAFKNKQDKEKQSTSTESYPLPPQVCVLD